MGLQQKPWGIDFYIGSVDVTQSDFDIVIANLAAPVLLKLKTELISRCKHYLILSGIPDSMFELVKVKFSAPKAHLEQTIRLNEWNGFIFKTR
jgi:ribosomal protein L11 methylase PrmA